MRRKSLLLEDLNWIEDLDNPTAECVRGGKVGSFDDDWFCEKAPKIIKSQCLFIYWQHELD